MEILVIRHGQSEADIIKCIEGRADFALTQTGEQQAGLMAEWIAKNYPVDFILSSTLKRAKRTAEILKEVTGAPIEFWDDLMEFNNGLVAGLTIAEADEKYPLPDRIPPHVRYYEKETAIEFRMRAEAVMSRIICEYGEYARVVVVSHGGMINMMFRSFMELPVNTDISIGLSDTAVSLWRIKDGKRQLGFINKTEHLSQLRGE